MAQKQPLLFCLSILLAAPISFAVTQSALADDKENHVVYGYVTAIERDAVLHETRVQLMDTGYPQSPTPFVCAPNGSGDLVINATTVVGYHSDGRGGYILDLGPNLAEDNLTVAFQGSVPGFGFYVIYNVIYNKKTNRNECVVNGLRSSL